MAPPKSPLAPLFAIALAGSFAVAAATSTFGIGVSSESETYIAAARNFAEGRGLAVPGGAAGELAPLTQHAPLYGWTLGLLARGGADPVDAARWLGAASFGALVLLAGLALRSLSKRRWLPPLASGLVVCSVVTLNAYLTALSESLFLLTTLAALVLLARYVQTAEARLLAASAVLCAVALLTRYAGVAVVIAGFAALLRYDRSPGRRAAAFVFLSVSCAPSALWAFYTIVRTGNPVHRELAFHPFTPADALAALQTVSTWLLPAVVPRALRFTALALTLLWLAAVLRRGRGGIPCRILLAFLAVYGAVIAAAKSFFDGAIPMDDRILSPLYVPALIAAALALDRAVAVAGPRWTLIAPAVALTGALATFNVVRAAPCLVAMQRQGREYTGAEWRNSALADWLRSVDPAVPIYSNIDSAVRFLRRGFSGGLPAKADIRSRRPNPLYRDELEQLRARLHDGRGMIVYFTAAPVSDTFLPSLPELVGNLRLTVVAQGGGAWVALRSAGLPSPRRPCLPPL